MNSKLYVGNLPPSVGEAELRKLFSGVGAVTEVRLVLDPATQQSRGHAFVTLASPELAAAALERYHCYGLDGRYITVTEARPPQEPTGTMSEGFASGTSALGPGSQHNKPHHRSHASRSRPHSHSSRPRSRRR